MLQTTKQWNRRGAEMVEYVVVLAFILGIGTFAFSGDGFASSLKSSYNTVASMLAEITGGEAVSTTTAVADTGSTAENEAGNTETSSVKGVADLLSLAATYQYQWLDEATFRPVGLGLSWTTYRAQSIGLEEMALTNGASYTFDIGDLGGDTVAFQIYEKNADGTYTRATTAADFQANKYDSSNTKQGSGWLNGAQNKNTYSFTVPDDGKTYIIGTSIRTANAITEAETNSVADSVKSKISVTVK